MSVAATFDALGEPSRRQIVAFLMDGEASVADIASQFNSSTPAISQHLKVLRDAGVVTVRPERQKRYYALNPAALVEAAGWLVTMANR